MVPQRRDDIWCPSGVANGTIRVARHVWRFPTHGTICWNEYYRLRGWRTCHVCCWWCRDLGAANQWESVAGKTLVGQQKPWSGSWKDRGFAGHTFSIFDVFDQLQAYGILINPAKCIWGAYWVNFLGHEVSPLGRRPLPEKIKAIQSFPQPKITKDRYRFLAPSTFINWQSQRQQNSKLHSTTSCKATSKAKL